MDINVYHPLTKDPYFGFVIIFVICILAVAWFIKATVLESFFGKDKNEEEIQKENENQEKNKDTDKSSVLKSGAIISTIKDSENNSYRVAFDPDKGLLVPMVAYYINSYNQGIPYVYYMKIPMDILKEIYDNFKNEVNKAEENHENEKNV